MDMQIQKIEIGKTKGKALLALMEMMSEKDKGVSYADMIRYRLSSKASEFCEDTYYVALDENGRCVCRHWNGWGKHKGAVGNFGNFFTLEEVRGQGIGGKMLDFWFNDINTREDKPLALFCSAGTERLVALYEKFGFRLAVEGTTTGPLYCPLGDSPETFREFCEKYYTDEKELVLKKAHIGYRHEIDCLLKFYFLDNDLTFGFDTLSSFEEGILYDPQNLYMVLTKSGKCVGWGYRDKCGVLDIQLCPKYEGIEISVEE